MEISEYSNLERVEREHWYYAGKREIVEYWIERCRPLRTNDTLLDFGAGTGLFARGFLNRCNVLVHDSYPASLAILRQHFPQESILAGNGNTIPCADASTDCVTALDVLEHLAEDKGAVEEFHRVLRSSGLLVVTVPADMKLWSDWDTALLHHRRYARKDLIMLFPPAKWEIVFITYTNMFAYPAVFLLRRWRQWTNARTFQGNRVEDRLPPAYINKILRALYTRPAKMSWFSAPIGVSLLMVARKR